MDGARAMRASDRDRQEVVDRLRTAMEDGRLTTDEFLDRVGLAYQATTYGDLAPLDADLPVARRAVAPAPAEPAAPAATVIAQSGAFARLRGVLRLLWAVWFTVVSINVVVWAIVSLTVGSLVYPWPLWVAGPYGAALFAISAARTQGRRSARS